MIDFHLLFLSAFFIYGLNFATDYAEAENFLNNGFKNVLWKLRFYSLAYIGEYWSRPLFTCAICMASLWGSIFYWGNFFITQQTFLPINIIEWLVFLVALAGLNRLLRNFV